MCTVVIEVPRDAASPTRVLAVRDEDPHRPWDPPGTWWAGDHATTVGVRDRRAHGAWLAASDERGRLAVVLNRAANMPEPAAGFASRGSLVLDAVRGGRVDDRPKTAPFTLVDVAAERTSVVSWDGVAMRRETLTPGIHMLAHHDVDDPRTERIARWLPEFRALAGAPDESWRAQWLALLARSAELASTAPEAIVRDNRELGFPTLSLLVCLAEVREPGQGGAVDLTWAPFTEPGVWNPLAFVGPVSALPAR